MRVSDLRSRFETSAEENNQPSNVMRRAQMFESTPNPPAPPTPTTTNNNTTNNSTNKFTPNRPPPPPPHGNKKPSFTPPALPQSTPSVRLPNPPPLPAHTSYRFTPQPPPPQQQPPPPPQQQQQQQHQPPPPQQQQPQQSNQNFSSPANLPEFAPAHPPPASPARIGSASQPSVFTRPVTSCDSSSGTRTSVSSRLVSKSLGGDTDEPVFTRLYIESNNLIQKMADVVNNVKRPNVLLAGASGSGKSSIINAVFGSDLAQAGAGKPITQHYTKFAPPGTHVCVYDAKGLEHGKSEEYIAETKRFIDEHTDPKLAMEDHIHVVWFVVNLATSRFQDFDEYLCREVFVNLPIIFLLNKRDLVEQSVSKAICDAIQTMKLPKCFGVFEVAAQPKVDITKVPDCCPDCGAENLLINKKKMTYVCEAQHEYAITPPDTGLDAVVEGTIKALPTWAAEGFAAAQRVSILAKVDAGKHIICTHVKRVKVVWNKQRVKDEFIEMTFRLGVLWDFIDANDTKAVRRQDDQPDEDIHQSNLAVVRRNAHRHKTVRISSSTSSAYTSFFRRVQAVIVDLFEDVTPSQARLGAEGILFYRAFAEAYMSVANRVLEDVAGNRGKVLVADFTPPDYRTIKAIESCIIKEGIERAFQLYLETTALPTFDSDESPTPSTEQQQQQPLQQPLQPPLQQSALPPPPPSPALPPPPPSARTRRESIPKPRGWLIRRKRASCSEAAQSIPMFGVELDQCVMVSGSVRVPVVFSALVTCLIQEKCNDAEGIFRVAGSTANVSKLRDYITKNPTEEKLKTLPVSNVHDVAGVLKHWFRDLPSPIIPLDLYDMCLDAQRQNDENKLVEMLSRLNVVSIAVLTQLVQLLSWVSESEAENKMNAHNLAVVFGPDVLRSPNEDLVSVMRDMPLAILSLEALIANFDFFFAPYSAHFRSPFP